MLSIAIRREDKEFETRTPIIPDDVYFLKKEFDIETYIQSSNQRAFSDKEYKSKGAIIEEEIQSKSDFIFALKEIPLELIHSNKKYIFFSHTLKGQEKNMPLLKRIINSKSTLIDYEKITDNKNKRLIYFGNYAGYAGMIDSFWALGNKLKEHGLETLFLKVNQAYKYENLEKAKDKLKEIGKEIDIIGLNYPDGPLIIGILGYGNVSKGVQEIINCLPSRELKPDELEEFFDSGYYSENKIYYVVFKEKDLVKPKNLEDDFEIQDYYSNPEKYESQFDKYMPYLTVIINAIYWEPKYPRFVTLASLKRFFEGGLSILRVIGDISCDINGAIELTIKTTTIKEPVYTFDLETKKVQYGFSGAGPSLLAIDNLPCELPIDSSRFFSAKLKNFIEKIVKANYKGTFEECDLPEEIKKAIIVYKGKLTPEFRYLKKFIED